MKRGVGVFFGVVVALSIGSCQPLSLPCHMATWGPVMPPQTFVPEDGSSRGLTESDLAALSRARIEVTQLRYYSGCNDAFYVLGIITNVGDVALEGPQVVLTLKDAEGNVVQQNKPLVEAVYLFPGEHTLFSEGLQLQLDGKPWKDLTVSVKAVPAIRTYFSEAQLEAWLYRVPSRYLKLTSIIVTPARFSNYDFQGQLQNGSKQDLYGAYVHVAGYDSSGQLIGVASGYMEPYTITVGGFATFSGTLELDPGVTLDHYEVFVGP